MSFTTDGVPLTMPVQPANTSGNGGNGMWGGDGWWVIVLFLIWGMWGGNWGNGGFGGGGSAATQGALTREQACIDNNFQNLMRETAGISDAVNNGFATIDTRICQQQYDTAQQLNGINSNMMAGFNSANVVALQNANALQAQIASCCCDQRVGQMEIGNQIERGFCQTNYNDQANTTAIIQNAHVDTDRVLARLDAMENARKDETIANLRAQLAACGDQTTAQYVINQITRTLNPPPVPAYPAASPCGLGNWSPSVLANSYGFGNCGCGCCNG